MQLTQRRPVTVPFLSPILQGGRFWSLGLVIMILRSDLGFKTLKIS